jgi:hypothetical protein
LLNKYQPAPAPGELNSNAWAFNTSTYGGSNNTGGGVSAGNVVTGTFYSFEPVPGDRALGVQPTDNFMTPGTITLRLQNTTGGIINTLVLSYKSYTHNNENLRTGSWLEYSRDNWDYDNTANVDTSTALADASPLWKVKLRSTRLTGLALPNGSSFYLRWNIDAGASSTGSNFDEFALDDIQIVAEPVMSSQKHQEIMTQCKWLVRSSLKGTRQLLMAVLDCLVKS